MPIHIQISYSYYEANEVILLIAYSSNIVLVVQNRLICITVLTSPHSSQLKLPLQVKLSIFSYIPST